MSGEPACQTGERRARDDLRRPLPRAIVRHPLTDLAITQIADMKLLALDWIIVVFTLLICFVPALFFGKRAGRSSIWH